MEDTEGIGWDRIPSLGAVRHSWADLVAFCKE